MATITEAPLPPAGAERRVVLRGITWDGYETLLRLVGDQPVRITYDGEDLEIMSPGRFHERSRMTLGRMVQALAEELEIDFLCYGSWTCKRPDMLKGLEPDDCYYIASIARVAGKEELDLTVDPPPDLAIEIDITRSSLDRESIHAALSIPEVWRFDGESLRVYLLNAEGAYAPAEASPSFPGVPMEELARFLREDDATNDRLAGRRFREWVRAGMPRRGLEAGPA